jgi:hypothetical protein
MLKQLRHKRFTGTMNDMLLSLRCYWYAQLCKSIVPVGNQNDECYQRPEYVHMQE